SPADLQLFLASLFESHQPLLSNPFFAQFFNSLLLVAWLTSEAKEQHSRLATSRAYVATSHEPTVLPLHAFCSYLIELCDLLESAPQNPKDSSGDSHP